MSTSTTRRCLVTLATTVLLATAACGAPTPEPTAPAPAAEGFPVTIEHRFGSTEIPTAPQRVVTVGLSDQDALLALGTRPVGVVDWYGGYPDAVWPWAEEAFGADRPVVVGSAGELDLEAIAGLQPDLILGLYSGPTAEQYADLARIAPTVVQPASFPDYGASWQDTARVTGRVLGQEAEMEELITGIEDRFARVRADHPGFAGRTAIAAGWNGPGQYFVYAPADPKSRFLEDLGFTLADSLAEVGPEDFGLEISGERLDLLDEDLAVWFTSTTPELRPELQASALYQSLRVSREGRDLFLESPDKELNGAISWSTVLSLPRALDGLVPRLDAALDGDPATTG